MLGAKLGSLKLVLTNTINEDAGGHHEGMSPDGRVDGRAAMAFSRFQEK